MGCLPQFPLPLGSFRAFGVDGRSRPVLGQTPHEINQIHLLQ